MTLTLNQVSIPAGSTIGFGLGVDERGCRVRFASDWRPTDLVSWGEVAWWIVPAQHQCGYDRRVDVNERSTFGLIEEQRFPKPCVAGSIPAGATKILSITVERVLTDNHEWRDGGFNVWNRGEHRPVVGEHRRREPVC